MFVDTSGLLCFLDAGEHRHDRAKHLLETAQLRLTHGYVLAELVALAQVRRMARNSVLDLVELILDSADFEVVWPGKGEVAEAMSLLRARPDKAYSLCDAVSFLLMRERRVADALTTDHHFAQEGFQCLLR
jgi:predicted nucleic acid-binding protein